MLHSQCVEKSTRWAVNMIAGLPFSARDRVAILGDAVSAACTVAMLSLQTLLWQVHAMETHLGAGAGQSIEVRRRLLLLHGEPR